MRLREENTGWWSPMFFLTHALSALVFVLCTLSAHGARADDIITDLSKHDIPIEWNFTGTEILLFGAIDSKDLDQDTPFDVIIIVRGPDVNIVARKKTRIGGMWINANAKLFIDVPSFYSIVSTRPIARIAPPELLKSLGIGLEVLTNQIATNHPNDTSEKKDAYSKALVRIKKKQGLYGKQSGGVMIIGKHLFRATIKLPANVPIGNFTANVYLFRGSLLLSRHSSSLHIQKQGIERFVYGLAYDFPLLYGLLAVALAVISGLLASAFFRRR